MASNRKSKAPATPTTRARVSVYLPPEAYEAFARDALGLGKSVSGHALAILTKHLQRNGYTVPDAEGDRATRSDFDPRTSLAKALRAKADAQQKAAEKIRARLAKMDAAQ